MNSAAIFIVISIGSADEKTASSNGCGKRQAFASVGSQSENEILPASNVLYLFKAALHLQLKRFSNVTGLPSWFQV